MLEKKSESWREETEEYASSDKKDEEGEEASWRFLSDDGDGEVKCILVELDK